MDEQNLHKELFEEPELKPETPPKKLARSRNDIVISGVCVGVANYFGWETATVRVAFVLSLLLGNWPIVFYLVTSLLLPVNKSTPKLPQEDIESINRANFKTCLSGVLMLYGLHLIFNRLGLYNSSSILEFPAGLTFPIAAIAVGVLLLSSKFSSSISSLDFPAKLSLSKKRKMFFGVCKGISEYLIIDVVSIRIVFILLSVFTLGLFALAYLMLGLLFSNKKMLLR